MKCFQCGRSGYPHTFQTSTDGKNWCGKCDTNGFITKTGIPPASAGGASGLSESIGTLRGLPSFATLEEWKEVQRLCKIISNEQLLLEEALKPKAPKPLRDPLALPKKANDGWIPLTEYYKTLDEPKPPTKTDLKHLFG
jgi:hypothetical protein